VLRALASDQQLLAIARQYLGTEPALLRARMWWSFAGPADSALQMKADRGFHYDIDGYHGLTFFFYLTDVNAVKRTARLCSRDSRQKILEAF
jgi:hypothetical protein